MLWNDQVPWELILQQDFVGVDCDNHEAHHSLRKVNKAVQRAVGAECERSCARVRAMGCNIRFDPHRILYPATAATLAQFQSPESRDSSSPEPDQSSHFGLHNVAVKAMPVTKKKAMIKKNTSMKEPNAMEVKSQPPALVWPLGSEVPASSIGLASGQQASI